jgi:hypothetical protein
VKIGRLRLGRDGGGSRAGSGTSAASLGETITLLRRYVVQEALGPLKHLGRALAYGVAGAFAFGVGGLFLVVGTLRLVQAESGNTFAGNWSFAPYVFAAVIGVALVGAFATLSLRGIGGSRRHAEAKEEER